ncbi:MAG: sulfatase-like hydrolase/transferase [Phycisphaerae bacterium]|nr:sulfatase-like hydrolase/transferase [Phycisphaerae bacterium]
MPDKPNVLFIVSDQHNAKVLGHKDHPDVRTPNLDRLAGEGTRFDNCITQSPICTPSRVSFLSGQYCHNHGYYGLSGPNPNGLPNVLGHFRRGGYTTAAIGKIHCPEYWVEDVCDLFLEVGNCSVGGNPEYQRYLRDKGVWDEWDRCERRTGPFGQSLEGFPSEQAYRDSSEGWAVSRAAQFMQQAAAAGRPFFCHVSFPKPHQVYCPAPEFWEMYDENALTLPPNADYEMDRKPPNMRKATSEFRRRAAEWTEFEPHTYEAGRRRKLRGYLGNVTHVDFAVGELLDALDQAGIAQNTIVVYTSDHGDFACEHGLIEKAPGISSDAITRVPLLWRCPGLISAGHEPGELVESVDVPGTLTALAGLPPMPTSDGRDISALVCGGNGSVREVAVTETPWARSIRKEDWRLVWYAPETYAEEYPDGFGELYNLADDPWEMTNLWFDPACAEKIAELQRDLLTWLVRTTRVTTVLPHFRQRGADWRQRYENSVLADGKIGYEQIRQSQRQLRNYI